MKIHIFNNTQFKNTHLMFNIRTKLDEYHTTRNTLISMLIKKGCELYENEIKVNKRLDELYGTAFYTEVNKIGETHIISANMEFLEDKYVDDDLFALCSEFFSTMISKNNLINRSVSQELFEAVKMNLINNINGKKDDKMSYASNRLIEELCIGEPYSTYTLGSIEEIDKITLNDLYDYYNYLLNDCEIYILGLTATANERAKRILEEKFNVCGNDNSLKDHKDIIKKARSEVNYVQEVMQVAQGKLGMGFRYENNNREDYYPYLVFSKIFGGGSSSKLFMNIREKESLCYYIFSSIDRIKALMVINSGVATENLEKAKNLVLEDFDKMQKGDFTDEHFEMAKNSIISGIDGITDSPSMLLRTYYSQLLNNESPCIECLKEDISKVTKEEVINAGNTIKLDTIYYLKGE